MNICQISENLLCSGCGTCNVACRRNAISMKKTPTMGLLYADIDSAKCTDCGLCLKMCPSANILLEKESVTTEQIIGNIKACYVGRSLNKEIFTNAQSGGVSTTILSYLFDNNLIDAAVCCRMDYGSPVPDVHYSILTNSDELYKNQKSCYTQVDIVSALKETSIYKSVAIVGVPCQIKGVTNLMTMKKFSNIKYRIGLICDKTYCDTYMNAIMYGENMPQGDVRIYYRKKDFSFNGTYHTYQEAPTVIVNEADEMCIIPNSKRMFLKEFFAVPKCKICWDKLNTCADICLGDPWGLESIYDKIKGDSLIIVRSNIGKILIDKLIEKKIIDANDVDINEATEGQYVSSRVLDIRNFNFKDKCIQWKSFERTDKTKLVKIINSRYYHTGITMKLKNLVKLVLRYK